MLGFLRRGNVFYFVRHVNLYFNRNLVHEWSVPRVPGYGQVVMMPGLGHGGPSSSAKTFTFTIIGYNDIDDMMMIESG